MPQTVTNFFRNNISLIIFLFLIKSPTGAFDQRVCFCGFIVKEALTF